MYAIRSYYGIDVEQLGCDVADLLNRTTPRFLPLVATEAVQRCILGRCPCVSRYEIECMHRDIELVAISVFEIVITSYSIHYTKLYEWRG